jgi:hypothetical protein
MVLAQDGPESVTSVTGDGIRREVTLELPMVFPIVVGATCDFYVGCDYSAARCITPLDNIKNMRAELFIPGNDQLLRTPDVPANTT